MAGSPGQSRAGRREWDRYCQNKEEKRQQIDGACKGRRKQAVEAGSKRKRKTQGDASPIDRLRECFADLPDPRIERQKRHLLIDIIVIAVCAVICNADGWKDISLWGRTHEPWLRKVLRLPNGIPSRDTFRRTVSRIAADAFQAAFLRWLSGLRDSRGKVIAIDGKTLRGTRLNGDSPLHIVSAWATENHITLGQRQVDGKSNEITAIPLLLQSLDIKGAVVTIDAMGCQKEIADAIVKRKGHYCLAAKGNQEHLAADIASAFEEQLSAETRELRHCETVDAKRAHGRYEERQYFTMPVPEGLRNQSQWKQLKSIGMTITYRAPNKESLGDGEVRYYIMSFASDVKRFAAAVRGHWGIENSLHWVMDVTFREDESRIHKDHGGENVSWLRRLAITLLRNETTIKDSIRAKRLRAGYDVDYLEKVLAAIPIGN